MTVETQNGFADGVRPITYDLTGNPTSKQAALMELGKSLDVFIARKTRRGDHLDLLIRGYAVSPEGSEPQKLTSPSPEAADQAAAAIVMEFGSDRQKHLVGIAGQIGGLIEQRKERGSMFQSWTPFPEELLEGYYERTRAQSAGQTTPRRSELSTIGQPDEFTASELDITPRVPAENSTRITINRRVQLQYYLAGISGARGPQNEAEKMLLEEMAQEANEALDQSQRLHRLPSTPILLD
jgi:hypothetical protein